MNKKSMVRAKFIRAWFIVSILNPCLAMAVDIDVEGGVAVIDGVRFKCESACRVEFDPATGEAGVTDLLGVGYSML